MCQQEKLESDVSSSEQIWKNVALHHLLTNGSSAVNGCRQNEIPLKHHTDGLKSCGLLIIRIRISFIHQVCANSGTALGTYMHTYIHTYILWCFNQLFELSFWRHPFTAGDPLVSKWCNAEFLQICSNEEKWIYILDGIEVEYNFSILIFLFIIFFNDLDVWRVTGK